MKKKMPLIAVWIGQSISLFGSRLTGFALGVWLYQRTGSASNFALVAMCTVLPQLIISPLAGVLVDRYNRRLLMALADTGSALCTLAIAALFGTGSIHVGHIYVITAFSAICSAFQAPAYSALVAMVIPEEQLTRANGLIQLGQGIADILAPAVAGVLVLTIGVPGVALIDLATFLVAVTTLLLAPIPGLLPVAGHKEPVDHAGYTGHTIIAPGVALLWQEARAGLQVLRSDRSLVALLSFQALFSFLWSLFGVLVTPMILGFTSPDGLGIVLTVAGSGMLASSLVISAWGGPRSRVKGLLVFEFISAIAFVFMGLRPSILLVAVAAFIAHWTLAFVSSLNESLWQAQTPAEVRGRVFALKQVVVKSAVLLAYILAGALADHVLNPLLLPGGALADSLGPVLGVGPGRGIGLLFVMIGLIKAWAVVRLGTSAAYQVIGVRPREVEFQETVAKRAG